MDSGTGSFDIILALLVAAFLLWRLHSVLGTTNEGDHQSTKPRASDPYSPPHGPAETGPGPQGQPVPPISPSADEIHATSVNAGLAQIAAASPGFTEQRFLAGAEQAFGMIVKAYAEGDRETLRQLLSNGLYVTFERALKDREAAGETQETEIDRITGMHVREAELVGRMARVTVEIVSEQVNVTRDRNGHTVSGHPDRLEEVHDIWTFQREVDSRDPSWQLVETRAPGSA